MSSQRRIFRCTSLLLSIVLGMSGILGVFPAHAASAIQVYLCQDFEDYTQTGAPPSGFEMTGITDVKKSSGALNDEYTAPNGTSVSLRINESVADQPDVGLAKRFGTEDLTGELILDFDIKLLDSNGSRFFEMKDSGNKGITLGSIGPDGILKVEGNKIPLNIEQWHRLSFAINYQSTVQTVSVYVDGVKRIDSITLKNSSDAAGINYVRIRAKRNLPADLTTDVTGNKNFTTLLDNMRVYGGTDLKTMEELQELNLPESLMDFDNDLGISVTDRLAGALAMVVNSPNVLKDNVRAVNAISAQNVPRKVEGEVLVPLRFAGQFFGVDVEISEEIANSFPHIQYTSDDMLVPLDLAGALLHKQVYTDYKGRGLIVIGNQAKPFDDALDKVDESIKPQNNEKFFIEEAIKEIVYVGQPVRIPLPSC